VGQGVDGQYTGSGLGVTGTSGRRQGEVGQY